MRKECAALKGENSTFKKSLVQVKMYLEKAIQEESTGQITMSNSFISATGSGHNTPATTQHDDTFDGTPQVLDTSIDALDVSIE